MVEALILGALLVAAALAVFAADDRLSGNEGIAIIDTPTTPLILDGIEWNFQWKPEHVKGRTFGNRATGRTHLGTDWEANILVRVRETGATPNFFRQGTSTGFSLKTDAAATPCLHVAGAGMITGAQVRVRVDEYIEYSLKIESSDPDETNLPTITPAT